MAIYNPSGSGNVHVDEILTQISVGYENDVAADVGAALFPTVTVGKQSDKYYVFGREAWMPEDDYRAPGTEANEVPGMAVSTDTYYAQEHSLQTAVTDEERENADSPLSPDTDATNLVTSKVLLGRERAIKTLVTTSTNYATGMTSVPSIKWDQASSDPIANFRTAIKAVHDKLFVDPNVAIIPYNTMFVLLDHPALKSRIQYTRDQVLTSELVASLLTLNTPMKIIVPGMGIGAGNPAAPSISYLWNDDVVLAYVPPSAGLKTPAFGYEFVWGYGGGAVAVDRWREEKRKSDVVRYSRRYDLKLVGLDGNGKSIAGYLLADVLT